MKYFKLITIAILVLLLSCNSNYKSSDKIAEKKEILIHCGTTMIKPITEIAEIIEKQENCKVLITKGGSNNLYKSIKENKIGDLYLPGSESYIEKGLKEKIIIQKALVGNNVASIMVQKGNPKSIKASLGVLLDTSLRIVIGNPNSGSIGKETKKILTDLKMFEEVNDRTIYTTIDSKDLISALKNNEADIIINWCATSVWDENKEFVDTLYCSGLAAPKRKLYIGLLECSKYPDIALKFISYATSDKGKAIFKKYGLY